MGRVIWMASRCRYFLIAVFLWTGALSAHAQTDSLRYQIKVSKYLMGTIVDATLIHSDVEEGRADLVQAFQEMERVEALLSMHRETSDIALVNRNAGVRPVTVHPETLAILSRAKTYADRLDGLFDVTVGTVTELWGFSDDQEPHLPPDSAITRARKLIDFRQLVLSERDTTAFLSVPGMKIDLGGIAKGYAIDRGASVLHSLGRQDFLINAGGDLFVSGEKGPDTPWRVGVRHPRDDEALLATLDARDMAVVTSGDYERTFTQDGVRYHHIIDPRTGYSATASQSVTIVAPTAEEADVLATYLFISADEATFHDRVDLGGGVDQGQTDHVSRLYLRVDSAGRVTLDPELMTEYRLELGSGEE